MALEHAILVSLAERSASGYDLARRFDASIGQFWAASHQQIYKVLRRMTDDGWVECESSESDTRPGKKPYAITPLGHAELQRWISAPTPVEPLRCDLGVKVRGLAFGDRGSVIEEVRRHRQLHTEKLAHYEQNEAAYFPDPTVMPDEHQSIWLILRGAIMTEQTAIAWCDQILQTVGEVRDAP